MSFRLFPLSVLIAAITATVGANDGDISAEQAQRRRFEVVEKTIPEIQRALRGGQVTSQELVAIYLERIATYEALLNAFITINPNASREARQLDRERARGHVRGPLHGIPVVLKDNIHTRGIPTSGGALAFQGFLPPYDAFLTRRLREEGAIILGKTVLTELANWVSDRMPANYSAVGNFGFNPYDPRSDPRPQAPFNDGRPVLSTGGSSSGIATSANLAVANVGTETSGSILSPSNQTMLVGIKPTVGLISRWGIIPITADQDTAGPMARTVTDAAILLGALTGRDPRDPATHTCPVITDYTRYLSRHALEGARIGIPRTTYYTGATPEQRAVFDAAIEVLKDEGADIVDPANIPSVAELQGFPPCSQATQGVGFDAGCSIVLKFGFKRDFNKYLETLGRRTPVESLAELIAFNKANVGNNAIKYGQARLEISEEMDLEKHLLRYQDDREKDLRLTKTEGIDAAIAMFHLDALLFPGARGADIAARPGYPSVMVPAGFVPNVPPATQPPFPPGFVAKPSPFAVAFTGKACSEGRLIGLAYAYEQASKKRVPPASAPPIKEPVTN